MIRRHDGESFGLRVFCASFLLAATAGCTTRNVVASGDGEEVAPPPASTNNLANASPTQIPQEPESTTAAPTPRRGPWEEFNASLFGTGLTEEEAFRRNHEERVIMEDYVAQCMREQGFEYVPFPGPGEYHPSDLSNFRWDDRDWVAQYGFGIVNSPSHTSGGAGAPVDPPELVDPNLEYGNNLPQAESPLTILKST